MPALGAAETVTVVVAVASAQPPLPATVYVITEVPALTPETSPVEALMVATEVVAEDQVPPLIVEESVDDPPEHTAVVPEIVPAEVAGIMVKIKLSLTVLIPVTVIVRVTDPALISAILGV